MIHESGIKAIVEALTDVAKAFRGAVIVAYPDRFHLRELPPEQRAARFRAWREGRRTIGGATYW